MMVPLSEGGCWAMIRSTSAWFCELWSWERGNALHEPSSCWTPRTARQSPAFATWIPSVPMWATQAVQPANATWINDNSYLKTLCTVQCVEHTKTEKNIYITWMAVLFIKSVERGTWASKEMSASSLLKAQSRASGGLNERGESKWWRNLNGKLVISTYM